MGDSPLAHSPLGRGVDRGRSLHPLAGDRGEHSRPRL